MTPTKPLPDWEAVLSAAARLQTILPDAVLVGGTAAAMHVGHRRSRDADHVVRDLKAHFDDVLGTLEAVAGWKTARVNRPVLILGSLDGIETGIRQLIRAAPLDVETRQTRGGPVSLPTQAETLRIKAALILRRNATRDYVDFIALADHFGDAKTSEALRTLDALYPQDNGQSALKQLIAQLATPRPYDRDETDLSTYKGLQAHYATWQAIEALGARMATSIFDRLPSV